MELRDIEIFLTLAEELHFGRTAERLHVTQGRVSQVIQKQERRIGALLFVRTNRRVALTPLGERFRDDLLPGYQQIQHAIARASEAGHGITGVVRVGFTAAWSGSLILRVSDEFRTRHPGCSVEIEDVTYSAAFEMLRTGGLDLLLAERQFAEGPDITVGPTVFSTPRALVVPGGHPLAAQETVSMEDLAVAPLITPARFSQALVDLHFPQCTPTGRPIPRGPVAAGWQEMLTLIGAGRGVTLTSVRAADFYARPDIAIIPVRDAPHIEYALLWPTKHSTAKVQAFVRTVVELAA